MSRTGALPGTAGIQLPGIRAWRTALFVVFASCGIVLSSLAARIPTIGLALSLPAAQLGSACATSP